MMVWAAFGAEWAQNKKVAFNGLARTITVNSDVTTLDLQTDVWSRWVDWVALPGNDYHTLAMRKSGYDAIPGGRSGLIYFLRNGWKLVVDLNKVRVAGVLYSDDYETAYWSANGQPIYPAVVSSLVNTATTTQNVVTGTVVTPSEIWAHSNRTLTSGGSGEVTNVEDIALAVRNELAVELSRIDVLLSTRSTVSAIWANVERTLTSGGGGGVDAGSAADIALAVREELATELARIDRDISSRVGAGDTIGANVLYIRGQAISGTGSPNNPWRPA
jgi:hypothetical protein